MDSVLDPVSCAIKEVVVYDKWTFCGIGLEKTEDQVLK